MRIAFLTEMNFEGRIPSNHPNMRTEFAWMHALNAEHYNIHQYTSVKGYDYVFIIFPKGRVYLDACGSKISNDINPVTDLLASDFISVLKEQNRKIFYVQEGPHWLYNDYELVDQINFYNMLYSCDAIFAHNSSDVDYYKGLFENKPVHIMPTLMIESSIVDIKPHTANKVIIGGNFARWYGGFESFIVAQEFGVPIWGQTSHAMREGESQIIQHLPRVQWIDWMKQLSSFRYAVHLMPTVAAGTFSLNCAYLGIPCIGNIKVDTQRICHPMLSVDIDDTYTAKNMARKLLTDEDFYNNCSVTAKQKYRECYSEDVFLEHIKNLEL